MAEDSTYADPEPKLEAPTSQPNKRKRDSLDHDAPRAAPHDAARKNHDSMNEGTYEQDFVNALAQHTDSTNAFNHAIHQNGNTAAGTAADTASAALHVQMNVPQPTELSFQTQTSGSENERPMSSSFNLGDHSQQHSIPEFDAAYLKAPTAGSGGEGSPTSGGLQKPTVGSEEWHKVRRDNHKEVERRRRETINEGINELAKIVPGCEKNKGSILQRAVQFITQLKENESQNIEKWTLEKLLTEQAIAELSASCDKLKHECQQTWGEVERWKTIALKMGYREGEDGDDDEEGGGGEGAEGEGKEVGADDE
ncbi:MAG: basic helix-loop-helix protein [Bathelium mastoideum]|nr:MAG: basic helix-loop-helix protein [Bathelium mastoideum]